MRLWIKAKYFWILSIVMVLVGCGFHLRGDVTFPEEYKTAFIESNEPAFSRDSVEFYVKRQLRHQIEIVDSKAQADLIVYINEGFNTRVVASTATGERRDYTTEVTATISVVDSKGNVIFPRENFIKARSFTIDEKEPLAKDSAEEAIARDVAEDLSISFIRRLITVIKAKQ